MTDDTLGELLDDDGTELADREPVVDAGRLAGLVLALVIGLVALIRLVLEAGLGDLAGLELAANAVASAGVALAGYLVPVWQARKARAKVTPLADPRNAAGEQLVPASYVLEPQTPGVADHAAPE